MKLNPRLILCTFLLVALAVTACWQPSMLRYGNRTFCGGTGSSDSFASWHRADAAAVLILRNRHQFRFPMRHWLQLQVLNTGTGEIEHDTLFPIRSDIRNVALSGNGDVIAVNRNFDQSAEILTFSFETGKQPERLVTIKGAERATWHPDELLLAAIHFPEGYDQGSNIIALYDVSGSTPIQTHTFELKNIAISQILGWSNNGQVIAVSQYDTNGEIPYYIFVESGVVEKSLFRDSQRNCIADAQWAPDEQVIAFSGSNVEIEGWDIFLERVASLGSQDGSLVNLTRTPQQDEINVSWSPDGQQIIYVKVFEDTAGNLQQELFLLNLDDASPTPIQLTDTPDELEASPLWISDSEIAYLSWSPTELVWSLNTVSVINHEQKRVVEIPQMWYREP